MLSNINFKLDATLNFLVTFMSPPGCDPKNELNEIFLEKYDDYIELIGKDNFSHFKDLIIPNLENTIDSWFGRFGEFYSVSKLLKILGPGNQIKIINELKKQKSPDLNLNDDLAIIEIYSPLYNDMSSFNGEVDLDKLLRSPIKTFMEGKSKIKQLTEFHDSESFKKKIGWVNTVFFKFVPFGFPLESIDNLSYSIWDDILQEIMVKSLLTNIHETHIKCKLDKNTFLVLALPAFIEHSGAQDYYVVFDNNCFEIIKGDQLKNKILE